MQPTEFVLEFGGRGAEPGQFNIPIDVVVDDSGEILVSDFRNHRVQRLAPDGTPLASFETLPRPGGISLGPDGSLYLTHFSAMDLGETPAADRVSVWDPAGRYLREWGHTGSSDGQLDFPGGVAIAPDGRVFIADQTNHRIQVFDVSGQYLYQWGEYGLAEGQFGGCDVPMSRVGGPNFVALDGDGFVYVTESAMCRVQKFTLDGRLVLAFGHDRDEPGGFGGTFTGFPSQPTRLRGPVGITIDRLGHVWVSTVSGRIQQFDSEGAFRQAFGDGQGTAQGQYYAPHGLACDSQDALYVVDSFNHRVQKFAVAL